LDSDVVIQHFMWWPWRPVPQAHMVQRDESSQMLQHFSGVSANTCHSCDVARFPGMEPQFFFTGAACTSACTAVVEFTSGTRPRQWWLCRSSIKCSS